MATAVSTDNESREGRALANERKQSGLIVLLCALVWSLPAAASGVYKWVDAQGKVHYSERAPSSGDNVPIRTAPPSSNSEPELSQGESVRGADGNCLTIKCVADEMEQSRLQREAEYAKQRAINDSHARPPKRAAATELPPQGPLYSDEYMRTQCLHGQCAGVSRRDCDDVQKLRQCARFQQSDREEYQRRHPGAY